MLEQMEESHAGKMETLTRKIASIDAKYEERIRAATEKHAREKDAMHRKI